MAALRVLTSVYQLGTKTQVFPQTSGREALPTFNDELYSSNIEKRSVPAFSGSSCLRHRTRFETKTILAGRIVGF